MTPMTADDLQARAPEAHSSDGNASGQEHGDGSEGKSGENPEEDPGEGAGKERLVDETGNQETGTHETGTPETGTHEIDKMVERLTEVASRRPPVSQQPSAEVSSAEDAPADGVSVEDIADELEDIADALSEEITDAPSVRTRVPHRRRSRLALRFRWTLRMIRHEGYELFRLSLIVVERFYRDRCGQAASALTFTSLLALVPLMAISFAIFSAFPAFSEVRHEIQAFLFRSFVPEVGDVISTYLNDFASKTANLTAAGVGGLTVSAVLLFYTIESTFNAIWRVERERPLKIRILVFWALLTLGPLSFGVSLSVSSRLMILASQSGLPPELAQPSWLQQWGPILMELIALTLLYVVVPAQTIRWRDGLVGAVLAAILFAVVQQGFTYYVVMFPTYRTIYGTLAALPLFLIWIYVSWTVVIIGAVLVASLPEWRRGRERALTGQRTPRERLLGSVAALAWLQEVTRKRVIWSRQVREGGTLRNPRERTDLMEQFGEGLEMLRHAGYVVRDDTGQWQLTRDLQQATLYDLMCDLGLAYSGPIDPKPDDPGHRTVAAALLAQHDAMSRPVLDQPLSVVVCPTEKKIKAKSPRVLAARAVAQGEP